MHDGQGRIRRLVLAYLERLGAGIEELGDDLFRVEMTPGQASELEGGWAPLVPWGSQGPAQVTYYFTFTPRTAETYPEAELIGPGSRRLFQVIESIRKLGCATRLWIPAQTAPVSYRPFYLFTLRLAFANTTRPGEAVRIAVDRVDQIALTQLARLLVDLPLQSGRPGARDGAVELATCDFERSFSIAFESLLEALEAQDASWARSAQRAVDRERERLAAYFAERERAGDEVREEKERRLGELEAARPKVIVRLQGVSELYLPVVCDRGAVRHLAFDMARYRAAPAPSRKYASFFST